MEGYSFTRNNQLAEAGGILLDPIEGIFMPLHEQQFETADIFLEPFYTKLARAERCRQALIFEYAELGLKAHELVPEIEIIVPEGGVLLVGRPLEYKTFIEDLTAPVPESSGGGSKYPGDYAFFDRFTLKGSSEFQTGVQVCLREYEDMPFFGIRSRKDGKYRSYNMLEFDPRDHQIGFLVAEDPEIIIKYPNG